MHDYYKHSFVTVSSDAAGDDHETFLDRDWPKATLFTLRVHLPSEGTYEIPLTTAVFEEKKGFVGRRAWKLQEDLLSPRTNTTLLVKLFGNARAKSIARQMHTY